MAPNPTLNQLINQQELNGFVRELTFDSEFPSRSFSQRNSFKATNFRALSTIESTLERRATVHSTRQYRCVHARPSASSRAS